MKANVKAIRQYKMVVDVDAEKKQLAPEKCLQYQWNFNADGNVTRLVYFGCKRTVDQEYIYQYKGKRRMAEQWFGYKEGKIDTLMGHLKAMQYDLDGNLKAEILRNPDFSEAARNSWFYHYLNEKLTQKEMTCGICPEYRRLSYRYNLANQLTSLYVTNVDGYPIANVNYIYNYKNQLITKRKETKEGLNETIIDPDESLVRYTYSDSGLLTVKEEFHMPTMDFRKKTEYQYYAKGIVSKEDVYLKPDVLSHSFIYECDYNK